MPAHPPDARPFQPRRAAAVLALLAALGAAPGAGAAAPGALALEDCRLEVPGHRSLAARCGSLRVAEDPATPDGPAIALRVAVIPALDRRRAREPLFIVAGGPGQAATDFYAAVAGFFGAVQRSHDVVLVDQRGTGGSNRLACALPSDFDVATPSPALLRQLSAACRRGLGGRPEFYTTSVAVRDLDAVRAALGFERINLYGISYGTRVVAALPAPLPGARRRGRARRRACRRTRARRRDDHSTAERATRARVHALPADAACERAFADLARHFEALRAELARAAAARRRCADPLDRGAARSSTSTATRSPAPCACSATRPRPAALLPLLIDRARTRRLRAARRAAR